MTQKYAILSKFFPNGITDGSDDKVVAEVIMEAIRFNSETHWEELSHRFHKDGKLDFEEYCIHMADALVRRKLRKKDLENVQG